MSRADHVDVVTASAHCTFPPGCSGEPRTVVGALELPLVTRQLMTWNEGLGVHGHVRMLVASMTSVRRIFTQTQTIILQWELKCSAASYVTWLEGWDIF